MAAPPEKTPVTVSADDAGDVAPLVSVVTPAYNAAGRVGGTIRSVLGQSFPGFELLVVDDGSVDGTADVVTSFAEQDARVRLFRQENGGISAARNRAIAEARGALIAFLDADDLWLPHYLQTMVAALEAREDASLVYTQAWILDRGTGRFHRRPTSVTLQPGPAEPPSGEALVIDLLHGNFVFISAVVRRQALDEVGVFDETLQAAEDYELWLRLAAHGHAMVRVPEPLAVYSREVGTVSSDDTRLETSRREIFRRYAADENLSVEVRALARKKLAQADRRLETFSGRRGWSSAVYRLRKRLAPYKRRLFGRLLRRREPPGVPDVWRS